MTETKLFIAALSIAFGAASAFGSVTVASSTFGAAPVFGTAPTFGSGRVVLSFFFISNSP